MGNHRGDLFLSAWPSRFARGSKTIDLPALRAYLAKLEDSAFGARLSGGPNTLGGRTRSSFITCACERERVLFANMRP
jgi:hypothetical protein